MSCEEADITVVSGKGRMVIPQAIREKLGIGPKTKLLVYGYQDAVIIKKMEIPDILKDPEGYIARWTGRSGNMVLCLMKR